MHPHNRTGSMRRDSDCVCCEALSTSPSGETEANPLLHKVRLFHQSARAPAVHPKRHSRVGNQMRLSPTNHRSNRETVSLVQYKTCDALLSQSSSFRSNLRICPVCCENQTKPANTGERTEEQMNRYNAARHTQISHASMHSTRPHLADRPTNQAPVSTSSLVRCSNPIDTAKNRSQGASHEAAKLYLPRAMSNQRG